MTETNEQNTHCRDPSPSHSPPHRQQEPDYTSNQTPHCNQPKIPINTMDSTPNSSSLQTRTTNTTNATRVWQWNCRGYRRKRGGLTQFLAAQEHKPDAVALQEVDCIPSLTGYVAFSQELADVENKPRVSTLVAKHIPVIVHTLSSPVPHVFLELLPRGRNDRGLFLLNVYSPPSRPRDVFDDRFRDAIRAAREMDNDFLMVGDLNATHPALGYAKATIKGRRLMHAIDVHRLTLLNEPDQPTRIGNSVSRDTCPDITLARTHDECAWTNLGESLGSDHLILDTEVPVTP